MKEFRYRAIIRAVTHEPFGDCIWSARQQASISFCAESKTLAWDHAHRLAQDWLESNSDRGYSIRVNRILKNDDHDFGVFKPC